jgi:hypothetical protein
MKGKYHLKGEGGILKIDLKCEIVNFIQFLKKLLKRQTLVNTTVSLWVPIKGVNFTDQLSYSRRFAKDCALEFVS